jgi:hypothetical protein
VRIHAIASTRQYARHVRAVWKHIDPEMQGEFLTGRAPTTKRLPAGDVVIVGGYYDIGSAPQRIIYVEHGAGQSYPGDEKTRGHPSYHGGHHPPRVIGYVSPSQHVADAWGRPAIAVGCPALDGIEKRTIRFAPYPVAALTFHFDARRVAPEAWSAREHYIDYLHNMVGWLQSIGYTVIGTWHPRDTVGQRIWRNLQIEAVADPDEVLSRAHLLVADNTSLMYEAAAMGIPCVALNAPWYRRDVEHGLRFWSHIPGQQVDGPLEFLDTNWRYYANGDKPYVVARAAADYAYALRPGHAGEVAARWVEKLARGEV